MVKYTLPVNKIQSDLNIFVEMPTTSEQYDAVMSTCKEVFEKKNTDYGPSWRLFRPSSLTDQIYIKAQRVRNIEQSGENHVGDDVIGEFMGIVNYSLMALIQVAYPHDESDPMTPSSEINQWYEQLIKDTKNLMVLKNSDYSEVWREMRISSFTDMILVKLSRIKQIEDNKGKTTISEGVEGNYQDIINYAIFALIRLND